MSDEMPEKPVDWEIMYAVPGNCESIRIMLRLGKYSFKETQIPEETMNSEGIQGCALNYKNGERVYRQGPTVLRLLARLCQVDGVALYPNDPIKGLTIDCLMEEGRMLRSKVMPCLKGMSDPDKKEEWKAKLVNEVFPDVIAFYEKQLNESGGPFLTGTSMSLADLEISGTLNNLATSPETEALLGAYPKTLKLAQTLRDHEGIKAARSECKGGKGKGKGSGDGGKGKGQ